MHAYSNSTYLRANNKTYVFPRRSMAKPTQIVETKTQFDEILENIDIYNDMVEKLNEKIIDFVKTNNSQGNQDGGGKNKVFSDTINEHKSFSDLIDTQINDYVNNSKNNFDEIFEKTQYYWYDEHLKTNTNKKPKLIKSLLQRFKKKVIPVTGVNNHFYNKKLEIENIIGSTDSKKFAFLITEENTYIESICYSNQSFIEKIINSGIYIPCYVCYNVHPFNETYIDTTTNNVKDIKDETKTYHIWIKVQNEIYIFSRPILTEIDIPYKGFPVLMKNLLMLHPYLFFNVTNRNNLEVYKYYNKEIENLDFNKIIKNENEYVPFLENEYVPFLQGNHYLCWLCTILNIIKIYNLYHPQNNFIKEEYQDLITKTMKTQSVLDFITIFKTFSCRRN